MMLLRLGFNILLSISTIIRILVQDSGFSLFRYSSGNHCLLCLSINVDAVVSDFVYHVYLFGCQVFLLVLLLWRWWCWLIDVLSFNRGLLVMLGLYFRSNHG